MPNIPDPVTLRNRKLPGVTVVKSRRSVPFFAKSGWVEVKSPAPAVEPETVPERDATPSERTES